MQFNEYSELTESLDRDIGTIYRDKSLEDMAKVSLPPDTHSSISVMYTENMERHGLRLIKFHNPSTQEVEYHVHNMNYSLPGKFPSENAKGFMDIVSMIHKDAAAELVKGNKVRLQSLSGTGQHNKYKFIANRLAAKANRVVRDLGEQPLTTAPFMSGPTLMIE